MEAVLGFRIDSTQASSAAVDLEKLYAAATKLDKAADSLEASTRGLNTAIGAMGQGAQKAKTETESVGRALSQQDDHVRAFRMEIERLTMKYQPLAQATQRYQTTVAEINRAHSLGVINAKQMQQALDAERMAFERLKTSAVTAGAAVKAANQNSASGAQRAAGINAGYQFQDIAVTAAMGMNPLMIGLQQGTQLASVVGSMERPVAGLAAAFASLINPVSLVTIGLTAGVAALVQYFTTADDGTDGMNADLRAQADLLSGVAERWGDLVPSVRKYADELTRAKEQAELLAGIEIVNQRSLEGTTSGLAAASISVADLVSKLEDAGEETDVILQLQSAVNQFNDAAAKGSVQLGQVREVQDALAAALRSTGIPAITEFREEFDRLSQSAMKSSKEVGDNWRQLAAALTSRFPSRGTYGGVDRSGNGRIQGEGFSLPEIGPTITGRPLIELDGLPGSDKKGRQEENVYKRAMEAAREQVEVLQLQAKTAGEAGIAADVLRFRLDLLHRSFKDGKQATADQVAEIDNLTASYKAAAEAAAKAKFAADMAFQARQLQRTSREQQIANTLRGYGFSDDLGSSEADIVSRQLQWAETKDSVKAFFTDFQSALQDSGGDIGEAFANALRNGIMNVANKLATQAIDQLSTAATNWLTGALGKAAGPAAAGFNPTTTLGALLGAGGKAANDNRATSTSFPTTDIAAYIRQSAIRNGIDPNIALRVAQSEGGLNSWNLQSNFVKNGVREPSFGPFQLYKGGGLGNVFQKQTGLDPALAENGPAGVDFALNHASKNGWGAWYGAKRVGIDNFEGIGKATESINKLGDAATKTANITSGMGENLGSSLNAAAEGLGKLGSGLGSFGQQVAQIAAGGGASSGGGFLGVLGKLFGGVSPTSSFWAPNTTLGSFLVNGFANGTTNAPGGMSLVGERGPELLNIPQGSGVMSNHKLMNALNNNGGGAQPVNIRVDVSGARGNAEIEDMVSKGVRQGIQHYDRSQAGRTAVKAVQSYQERYA